MNRPKILTAIENRYESSEAFRQVFNLGLLLLSFILILLFVLQPTLLTLESRASRVAGVRNVEENLIARSNRIQTASETIKKLSTTELSNIKSSIPTSPDVLSYVDSLERQATAHNVSLEIVSSKDAPLISTVEDYKNLEAVEINASIKGSFGNIERFLTSLEDGNRVAKLIRLKIANAASGETLIADIGLNVYYIR